jgi:glycosyltransferase involved in cell wall biosynthesis
MRSDTKYTTHEKRQECYAEYFVDSEGFGLVFLEAAASGKLAIAGKAGVRALQ